MAGELIFLTGGTGFLGRHLAPLLLQEGYRLRMLARPTSPVDWLAGRGVELVIGDLNDGEALLKGMKDCEYVIHAAGHFRLWGTQETFESVNVEGTARVAEIASSFDIKRFVYISSVAVVGDPPPGQIIDEMSPCNPQDAYQQSKFDAERKITQLVDASSLPAVILRPGAFYGPYGRYGFNRIFIEDPMRGLRFKVDGGNHYIFPVFVQDAAQAICLAMRQGRVGEIYNISDLSVTHNVVDRIVSDLLGIGQWRINMPSSLMIALAALMEWWAKISRREPFYPLNLRHYVFNDWQVNSDKARAELGFSPTPLEEGLRQTIAWYQAEVRK